MNGCTIKSPEKFSKLTMLNRLPATLGHREFPAFVLEFIASDRTGNRKRTVLRVLVATPITHDSHRDGQPRTRQRILFASNDITRPRFDAETAKLLNDFFVQSTNSIFVAAEFEPEAEYEARY